MYRATMQTSSSPTFSHFGPLEKPDHRTGSFWASFAINLVIIAVIVVASVFGVRKAATPNETATMLYTPPPPAQKPLPTTVPRPMTVPARPLPAPPVMVLHARSAIPVPKPVVTPPKLAAIPVHTAAPQLTPTPIPRVVEAPQVHVDIFKAQHSAQPRREVAQLSTGAFRSAQSSAASHHLRAEAVVGGFGSASALGHAQNRTEGRIATAGFSSGRQSGQSAISGHVAETSFGATQSAATRGVQAKPQNQLTTNVVVLSDPKPGYTAEARQLKIQGDVVLRVRFTTNGQIQVLGVLHGLGHGLDQLAEQAAERIRFKPATSNGRPVAEVTLIHILFQLS